MAGTKARWGGFAVGMLIASLTAVALAPPAGAARDISRFACPPTFGGSGFADVTGTTHEDAIACAVDYGLTDGVTSTTFDPSGVVSRGQMATFVVRLIGFEDFFFPDEPSSPFADTADSPHEASIATAVELGIVEGTGPSTFSPTAPVSRAQIATFVARALEFVEVELPHGADAGFVDIAGSPHADAINALAEVGIVDGVAPGTYDPAGTVSRGAMAAILVRAIDHGIETGRFPPITTTVAYAALTGDDGADPAAAGTAAVATTEVPGVICMAAEVDGFDDATAVEITRGEAVVATMAVDPSDELLLGCISDPDAEGVALEPEDHGVRVRSAAAAVAGPLGVVGDEFGADLSPVEVFPEPGDRGAFGSFFGFTTSQPGVICSSLLFLGEEPATEAHLHRAQPHANGPEVLAIEPVTIDDFDVLSSTIGLDCSVSDVADDLAADPTELYVDVHTASFPEGALRGQLDVGGFFFGPTTGGPWARVVRPAAGLAR